MLLLALMQKRRPRRALVSAAGLLRQGLLLFTFGLVVTSAAGQDGPSAPEAQVKAAYLHKFPGFVEWPSGSFTSATSPLVMGVAGAEAVYQELSRLAAGRQVQGRAVEVRRVSLPLPDPLHLLYIGPEARREAGALLARTVGRPVLTVTDDSALQPAGAVLNLVEIEGRVRFEASPSAATASGLKLSSRLLNVAARVIEKTP